MNILDAMIGKEIIDIYTVGFVDIDGGCAEYYPRLEWVYFEFEDMIVEFEAFNWDNCLGIQEVEGVRYLFESVDDMVFAKSSVKDIILVDSMRRGNVVREVELKSEAEKGGYAVKMVLENGQVIFIDNAFLHGLGIGGCEQEWYGEWCRETCGTS